MVLHISYFVSDAALLQQSELARLSRPNPQILTFLQQWMQRQDMGNVYLHGLDHDIWSRPDLPDLVSLKENEVEDVFTRWVSDIVIKWYHRTLGHLLRVRSRACTDGGMLTS